MHTTSEEGLGNQLRKSEFADLQGWSRAYVSKLNRQGRLVLHGDGRHVLLAETLERLSITASPEKKGVSQRWARERKKTKSSATGHDTPDALNYQYARAKRERHQANLAELEEAKKRSELLDRTATERAVTDAASMTRQALQRLPDRLASPFAAESDPQRVYAQLEAEIEQICDDLYAAIEAAAEASESSRQ